MGSQPPAHIAHPVVRDPFPFFLEPYLKPDPDPWDGNPMRSQPKGLLTPWKRKMQLIPLRR